MADASAPKGARAPLPGEIFRNPALARSLREVASGGKRAFYEGRIGRAIAELVQEHGGAMSPADLADHKESTFDEPISVPFRGVDVYEHGPNGSGVTALIALRILEAMHPFPSSLGHNSAPYLHALIEALRLAFADARWYVSDPAVSPTPMEQLLSAEYAAQRAGLIDPTTAAVDVRRGSPAVGSDTMSFQVVDVRGNAVSMVNSNFMGFGTGLVPTGCGFSMQNRGAS